MGYLEEYYTLKNLYDESKDSITIPGANIIIRNYKFNSVTSDFFPGNDYMASLFKRHYGKTRPGSMTEFNDNQISDFKCNTDFVYPVYCGCGSGKRDSVIILLHGLNESSWDKYHSWAKALIENTGQPVIMFPISFHINRRPQYWTETRKMNALSKERKSFYDDLAESSFVNAAISTRLQFASELFFWSGLRTYIDILRLTEMLTRGDFDFAAKNTRINFFGYSIGAFLVEVLMMSRYDLYEKSKAVLFCGGPAMDLMYPASKYIYDTETEKSMNRFYIKDFENALKQDKFLYNYFHAPPNEALAFRSMLNTERFRMQRENMLERISGNVHAVCLKKDTVMPPESVRKTLEGENCVPGIKVTELDFPFEYDHISPFPLGENIKAETDRAFNEFIKIASEGFV